MREHTYVDDVLAGGDSLEDALEVKKQTEQMLQAGGFSLSKWAGSRTILCPTGAQRLFSEPEGVGAGVGCSCNPVDSGSRYLVAKNKFGLGKH